MNRYRGRQQGMTMTGILIVVFLVGFFLYTGVRLAPVYLEYYSVKSSLESLAEEDLDGMGLREIRELLMRRLEINNVEHVKAEHVSVRAEGKQRIVSVDYEVRTPFYGNLYFLASFSNQAELSAN